MMKKDTLPFSHGVKGNHIVCKSRLEKMGVMATCCVCDPHYDCEAIKKSIFTKRRHPNFIDKAIENIEKKVAGKTNEEVQEVIDALVEEEWILQPNRWTSKGEHNLMDQPDGQQNIWLDKLRYFMT